MLVRRGFETGEIMVVLVLGSPILPSKNNFVKALRKVHPEITTVVLNVNNKQTSMVLGEKGKADLRTGIYQRQVMRMYIPHFSKIVLSGKSGADRSSL